MITPAFHFEILNEFVTIMENRTLELIEMLKKFHEKDESFNAFEITKPFSLSVICETSMGIDLTIEEKLRSSLKTGKVEAIKSKELLAQVKKVRPSTREWFNTARNYALYSNTSGIYDDIVDYLKL